MEPRQFILQTSRPLGSEELTELFAAYSKRFKPTSTPNGSNESHLAFTALYILDRTYKSSDPVFA